jgi:hypothetical protein
MSQHGKPDRTKTGPGSLATPEVKELWRRAWQVYQTARVAPPPDWMRNRNERLRWEHDQRYRAVAEQLSLTRKQAKRRVKNYRNAHREGRI